MRSRRRWRGWRLLFVACLVCGLFFPDDSRSEELLPSSVQQVFSERNRPASPQGSLAVSSAPPPSTATGQTGKVYLFGTLELRTRIGDMPKWIAVLDRERRKSSFTDERTFRGSAPWKQLREEIRHLSPREQIREVNSLVNRWPYRNDRDVWGIEDFWAAPADFFQKSGDCEDYAIAKYFALRNLGFPPESLRIVVLQDTLRGLAHAVCVVFIEKEAWVLDNVSNTVLSHSRLLHYKPQFSVNEVYRWAHLVPGGTGKNTRKSR